MIDDQEIFRNICGDVQHTLENLRSISVCERTHHATLTALNQRISEAYDEFKHKWMQDSKVQNATQPTRTSQPALGTRSTASLLSTQPNHGRKRAGSELQPQQRGNTVQTTKSQNAVISFPQPPDLLLPPSAAAVLVGVADIRLAEAQWTYWNQHNVLPITMNQWHNLPTLLDEVQHHLDEQGAIVLQPDWKHCSSLKHDVDLNLPFNIIRSIPSTQPHIAFKLAPKEQRLVRLSDESPDDPLDLDEFEQMIRCRQWQVPYANEIDLSNTKYLNFCNEIGIIPRLRRLPGDELPLASDHTFPGVNDAYLYLGSRSSSFYLHVEDEQLYSFNMVHAGMKRWRVFAPDDLPVIERHFRQGTTSNCNQFIRHQNIYMPNQLVRELGLSPLDIEQQPGQVVITVGDAYHQGFNAQPCISEAVNYARNWKPLQYRYCDDKFCHLSTSALCAFQYLRTSIRINDYETLDVPQILEAQSVLEKTQKEHGIQSLRQVAQGLPQHTMILFIILIGKYLPDPDSTHTMPPVISDTPSLENAYAVLVKSRSLAHYSEILQRYAILHIHLQISNLVAHKRKQRQHRKGIKSREIPRECIVEDVAKRLAASSDTSELDSIKQELNSYTFRNHGEALSKLVAIYGFAILLLIPGTPMCNEIGVKFSWLGDTLKAGTNNRNQVMCNLFMQLLVVLRPRLRLLCTTGAYSQLWNQLHH